VYRSRAGGNEWEPLTKGLPQSDCYVNVLREAMAVDSLDKCGVYFGTTGGQVYASTDGGIVGRRSCAICRGAGGGGTDAQVIGNGQSHSSTTPPDLANVGREVTVDVTGPVTQRTILTRWRRGTRFLRGTIRDHVTQERRPLVRFFACEEDVSHESPDVALPEKVASGQEAFHIIGAIAGGMGRGRG